MKYLVFNTETEALNRTAQEAEARGCIGTTRFWWGARQTKAGQWALCISDDDQGTLTDAEKSQLKNSVVWPDDPNP
tara:strand:- start:44 stop:271 length:228 start_codon:yes stop_codon:yes gene_type:complete